MRQDQREGRRAFPALMDEVDANIFRRVPIMVERRESFDLRLPIETVSPVFANLFQKL